MIDLHSHILPNIDDGAKDLEMAAAMVKIAQQDGIEQMVATPHLFRGEYVYDDLNIINKELEELRKSLTEKSIKVNILAGAEVHISHNLMDEIRKHRNSLVINNSSYMFVEFPTEHVFTGVKELFFELMSEGITPIIAHPERNSVFRRNPRLLYELIRMGGLAQANRGSFTGLYGRHAQETVFFFLKKNLLHFCATDCHDLHASAPRLLETARIIAEASGEKVALAMVRDNPKAVVDDRLIPYLPDPIDPEADKRSMKIKLPSIFRNRKQ